MTSYTRRKEKTTPLLLIPRTATHIKLLSTAAGRSELFLATQNCTNCESPLVLAWVFPGYFTSKLNCYVVISRINLRRTLENWIVKVILWTKNNCAVDPESLLTNFSYILSLCWFAPLLHGRSSSYIFNFSSMWAMLGEQRRCVEWATERKVLL